MVLYGAINPKKIFMKALLIADFVRMVQIDIAVYHLVRGTRARLCLMVDIKERYAQNWIKRGKRSGIDKVLNMDRGLQNSSHSDGLEPIVVRSSRRSFLKMCGAIGLTATVGPTTYGIDGTNRIPVTEEFDVFDPLLKEIIRPITIVQVTDLHFGFFFGTDDLERLVTQLNSIEADALMLTGDIFHSNRTVMQEAIPLLKQLRRRRHGNYAVTGNHEYYAGEKRSVKALEASGLRLLRDEWISIEEQGRIIHLGGLDDVGDTWPLDLDFPRFRRFMRKAPLDQGMRILLSHRPSVFPAASQSEIDLVLAGHTHGGQIVFPRPIKERGLRQLVLARRNAQGWYRAGKCRMYVSRGIGFNYVPIRINCPPEISVFHLREHPIHVT